MSGTGGATSLLRKPVVRLVVIAVWCAVLLLGVLLAVKLTRQHRLTETFSVSLSDADSALTGGDARGASNALRNASLSAQTAGEWLSVLKRAREIGGMAQSGPDRYALMVELGGNAVKAFPGNQSLWAVLVWAQMQDGKIREAATNAARYLTDSKFESLRVEAMLRDSSLPPPGKRRAISSRGLELLTELPASRKPDAFRSAGDLTGDHRFYVDMVLLEAEQSARKALKDYGRLGVEETNPRLGVLLAFDNGDFDTARAYMHSLSPTVALGPEMVLLQADMFMAEKKYSDAAEMYRTLMRNTPDVSSVLYQNLAFIEAKTEGTSTQGSRLSSLPAPTVFAPPPAHLLPRQFAPQGDRIAEQLLEQGLSAFPGQPDLVRARAQLFLARGQFDRAATGVENYLQDHPQDSTMRLFRIDRLMPHAAPPRITSLLWDLITEFPENALAGQVLAGRLLTIRDFNGLEGLTRRYTEPPTWIRFYQGVVDAARQETANARAIFNTIWEKTGDWQAAYDVGLTYLEEGSIQPALHALNNSEQAANNAATVGGFRNVPGFGPSPDDRAMLEYYRAEALAAQAELDRALEAARVAAGLSPKNVDVNLLLRKLEAAIQR